MSAETIRTALGVLQEDPDQESAWNDLQDAVTAPNPGMDPQELGRLLEAARQGHEQRREYEAVAKLLELEISLVSGRPNEIGYQAELARVLEDELLDDKGATAAYKRMLEIRPGDATATEALERNDAKRDRWKELVERYVSEVEAATDSAFKSSLLMSAAETAWRFGGKKKNAVKEIINRLEQALETDPKNRRAALLLERIYRREERWDDAARVMEKLAVEGTEKAERVAAFVRLGRVLWHRLNDKERAASAYERVLDMAPGHAEAMRFLAEYFSEKEQWEHLVALYEDQLRAGVKPGQEIGIYLQIGMIHWRMRQRPDAAEPWFERARKIEPANGAMLNFFRELCSAKGQRAKLVNVLTDAQRALPDGKERAELASEIAKLAEEDANAGKAIEQYKSILRADPSNKDARDALRRLYAQTEAWNALVELLRQELERTPADDRSARLAILHEIARIYRQHIKSDTALVTVLTQIVQLDDRDVEAVRDLVRVYEALQRWRDLLTYQQKLADLSEDPDARASLYRQVARRWLEQFSNVQNATDAYEALLRVAPEDDEARTKLRELYGKRRAWPQLYALCEEELKTANGQQRVDLLGEMAKLAAERLDRGQDAIRLYKEALDIDSAAPGVLDALEKQAERDRDFATVAEVLERRANAAPDEQGRLAILQKLGSVYADRLADHVGAARAWRRVLEIQPGHPKALRVLRDAYLASGDLESLEELYASQNDWEGLAEVLSAAADKVADPTLKVTYSFHVAKIYEERLRQPERAFRAYERVLSVRPNDQDAARALVPIYEKEERWARLPALYEILLSHAETTEERVALTRRLAEIAGQRLQDRNAAVTYAKKAYALAPTAPGAIEFLEKAAREAGAWDALVEAIRARIERGGDDLSKTDKRHLQAKLAEIYATQHGRFDEAVNVYRELVEEDPGDEKIVEMLDSMLRSSGRHDDLRWLFELRVRHASPDERVPIYREWATLEEEVFGDPNRAIFLYRKVLEIDPAERSALSALTRLLLAANDVAGAADVLVARRDLAEGRERAERELDLAELYLGALAKPSDALESAIRALDLLPHDARAVSLLERLVEMPATRDRAAEVLQNEYESGGDARREASAVKVMLDGTTDPARRLELFAKLATIHERKLGSASTALDTILQAVSEQPTEIGLWDRASDLATASSRLVDLAEAMKTALLGKLPEAIELELCEREATLYDDKLGNPEAAVPYLERILERHPTNDPAFNRLKQILTSTEKWSHLEALYEKVSAAAPDPGRKVELYAEVALVCEEITGESAKAIGYYERILEIDPIFDQALRSLDTLYQAEKRPRELSKLLERRIQTATASETTEYKLRLGRIHLDELHEPQIALDHLEEVLRADPNEGEARALVERILEVGSLRSRAAEVLENVYAERDDARNLVRVLEIRLESAENDDLRRDLLRRIAELRDQRLQDDRGSLETLARLVPLDPSDADARKRLLEIGRRLDEHQRVATVLLAAADAATEKEKKAEILMEIARIFDDLLGDRARAEEIYRRVVDLDREDADLVLPAARSLERIYESTSNPRALAEILRLEVGLDPDGEKRRELWARLGELSENVLDDLEGAIAAWRARLEDDAADDRALAALERLYDRTQQWRDLVTTLRAREQVAKEPTERRRLLTKAAETLATKLGDKQEAIFAWRAVVDEFGPDRQTLAALASLYEQSEEWTDLASTLETDLSLADDDVSRLAIFARLGDVRRKHQSDLLGALDAYRQALSIDPSHAESRAALESLLDNADARRDAAEILHPLYEADGNHEKLLKVLEIEADAADTPSERLSTLEKAVRVAEGPLADPARAFELAKRGLKEAAAEDGVREWIDRVEALAKATGRYAELVQVLSDVSNDILDGDVQLAVRIRIAEIARTQLGDRALARDWYKKALALRSDDRTALTSLESLYQEMGDAPELLEVVKRRVEAATDDAERKDLLFRQAKLTRDVQDARDAISVYEQILDIGLDKAAIDALEQLYGESGRWHDLVSLYERQIGENAGPKADLHVKIANVAETHLRDVPRAFDELEEALKIEAQHHGAIELLERLLASAENPEDRARAGEMLEPVYLRRADWKSVMKTLEARLAASDEPEQRRNVLKRLAQLHEEQEENYRAALETTAKLLHEALDDEDTWAELERLAKVAGAEDRLAEIYASELAEISTDEPHTAKLAKRTAEIYAQLGKVDAALKFHRRALAFEPESREIFAAIDGLLVKAGRASERVELYRQGLDQRYEPADRLRMLHVIAELEENALAEPEKAIDTYRAALDVDEKDARSLDALTRLYRDRKRFRDLADLYQRRAELESDVEASAAHRLALARLYRNELADASAAIDQLETIVSALPWHKDAIAELEKLTATDEHKARVVEILRPLYERGDSFQDLIRLNEQRLSLAEDAGEKIAILRETAKLYEERAGEPKKAFDAIRKAFALDPEDSETRAELDRLAESLGAWDALAESYEQAIAKGEEHTQRDLLGALARVHDTKRDDPRKALEAYDRLSRLDESDPEPLEAMDQLAMMLSDWPTVVRVLTKKAELSASDEDRASLWRRVGEAKRDMLDDHPGAIEAYEQALELDPQSVFTVDCLVDLYEAKDDSQRLVELYRRRVELAGEDEADLKYEVLKKVAERLETKLHHRRDAIEALREALAARPNDKPVLRWLDRLLREEEMWPELLDNLRLEAATAETAEERVALRRSMGDLQRDQLGDQAEALECYRQVLEEAASDDAAIASVRAIGEKNEELRQQAADVLEPVLRSIGRWNELVATLELRLRAQQDPASRAQTLRSIAIVEEINLGSAEKAESALLRALAETPDDEGLHAEIERLAEASNGFGRYADALEERASAVFDATVTRDLHTRLGKIAEEHLKDDARAITAYRAALEDAGDSPELISALDRLYTRTRDWKSLAEILERRVAIETSDAARADLHHRLALLQMNEFGDKNAALGTLRLCLEASPEHAGAREALESLLDGNTFDEAAETLEGVYRSLKDHDRLATLLEKRISRAGSAQDRVRQRLELARVLEQDANDPRRAQSVLESALKDDPSDADVLVEIERLAPINAGYASAATALSAAIEGSNDLLAETARDLWTRVAEWHRTKLSDASAAEQAYEKALAKDPESLDILRALEDLRRAPGRERALVETLRRRAKLETDIEEKKKLLREAKTLAETTVADPALAEETLRQLLAENEADPWALAELERLRETAGDWAEATKLLLRHAEVTPDMAESTALRHRAAETYESKLADAPSATKLYEELLEADPGDHRASAALRRLYDAANRPKDLGRLLERLVDAATSASERTTLRLELARLQADKLKSPPDAIETLRAILDEEAGQKDAVVELSQLYERTGKDDELADLLDKQIELAKEKGDTAAELVFKVRLGEIYETRLKDAARAIETYKGVLEREPTHEGALQALARLHEGRGETDDAIAALEKLLELEQGDASVQLALRLAAAYGKKKDDEGARRALEKALAIEPQNGDVRGQLRALYERTKDWQKLADLVAGDADAASATPEKVKLLRQAASIHREKRQDAAAAATLLEKASALAPEDRDLLLALCDAYSSSGRGRDAVRALEKVKESFGGKRSKELAGIHQRLAQAYLADGDKSKALTELDAAFKIDPGSINTLRDLGMLTLELGDLERAQKTFRALLLQKLEPPAPITKAEVFFYLGDISHRQGDKPKAIQMLDRALENDGSLQRARDLLAQLKA